MKPKRTSMPLYVLACTLVLALLTGCSYSQRGDVGTAPQGEPEAVDRSAASTRPEPAGEKAELPRPGEGPYGKPGFVTFMEDKRLWDLRPGAAPSEKHVTLIGAGPMGMTVKALSREAALEYLAAKPGFAVEIDEEGRIWVFRDGEPRERHEKHITRVGVGPMGRTVKALDRTTLDAYMASRF